MHVTKGLVTRYQQEKRGARSPSPALAPASFVRLCLLGGAPLTAFSVFWTEPECWDIYMGSRVARCFQRCVWLVYAALLFELGQAGQLSARPSAVRPSDSRVRSFHGCAQKASALLRSTAHWWPRSSAMTTPCTDSTFLVVRPFAFFTCTLSASMRGLAYLCRCYADSRMLQFSPVLHVVLCNT